MSECVVVYLHGLNSSRQALKAQQTECWLKGHHPEIAFYSPQIPNLPEQAVPYLRRFFAQFSSQRLFIIGSSLGGLYARYFAEKYLCKAALINPLVAVDGMQQRYQGEHINPYTQESYHLSEASFFTLQSLTDQPLRHPDKLFVLLQMADEVLDAHLASQFYLPCRSIIQAQGNHRFENYQQVLPAMFAWFLME